MTKQNTDSKLLAGLKSSDSRTFDHLFDQFYPALRYFAERLIGDTQEAEDIVLDTFSKFWTRRENFETLPNIRAFLYITTRNACFNFLKYRQLQRKREHELTETWDPEMEENAEQLRVRSEVLRLLQKEIDKLPRKCRLVFELTFFEELKPNEIADLLHISVNTVRNQKARALQLLKGFLNGKDLMAYYLVWIGFYCANLAIL